jgi:hypothetical protein
MKHPKLKTYDVTYAFLREETYRIQAEGREAAERLAYNAGKLVRSGEAIQPLRTQIVEVKGAGRPWTTGKRKGPAPAP